MTGLVVAVAVLDVLEAPTRLLAARRSAPASLAGRWELPGGKVEPDEDAVAAVHREIREELGVRIALDELLPGPIHGDWPINERLTMRVWTAVVTAGEPAPLADHDELRWLPRGRWHDLGWLPADVPVVTALEARVAARPGPQPRPQPSPQPRP